MSSNQSVEEKLYKLNEAIQATTKSRKNLESVYQNFKTTQDSVRVGKDAGASLFGNQKYLVAIGDSAGYFNTTGEENVFIGKHAGKNNRFGDQNIAIGPSAGATLLGGHNNIMLGNNAGKGITYGHNNIILGQNAGNSIVTGSHNIVLGNYDTGTISNALIIGTEKGNQPLIDGNFATGVVKIPTLNINNAFTFPTGDGSTGQTLRTDGEGALYWSSAAGALSNLTSEGTLSIGGNTTLGGDVLIYGTTTLLSNVTVGGTANVAQATINSAYTFPTADGTNGQVIKTDGAGNLTWEDESGSNTSLELDENLTVRGSTTLSDTVNIMKELIVNGVTSLSGRLHSLDDVYIEGNLLSVAGDLAVVGSTRGTAFYGTSLSINGQTTLDGSLKVEGNATISGSLVVTDNLIVSGDQLHINVETVNIEDPVIHLNSLSGTAGQDYDIGFIGSYTNGSTYYTGLVRDSSTDAYYLFNTSRYVSGDSIGDTISGASFTDADLARLHVKSAKITSDLSVQGNTTLSGSLSVVHDVTISGSTTIHGNTTLSGTTVINNHVTLSKGLRVAGNTTLSGTFHVDNAATISGSLQVIDAATLSDTLLVKGNTTLSGTTVVNNHVTLSKGLRVAGNTTLSGTLSMGTSAFISERIEMGGTNIKIGTNALSGNSSDYNVAVGYQAGEAITSGSHIMIGYQAGQDGEGDENIGVGYQSLHTVSGSHNMAAGNDALFEVIGHDNVALGASGGKKLQGSRNIIVGNFAVISGAANRTIAIGYQAGMNAETSKSVMIGYQAGISCTGYNNVFLGYQAGSLRKEDDNALVIGNENAELITGNFVSGELEILADLYVSGNIWNPVNNADISTGGLTNKIYTLDLSQGNVHVLNIQNSTDISLALTGLDDIVGQRGEIIIDSDSNNITTNYMEFNGSEWAFVSGTPTIYFNNKYDKFDYTVISSTKVVCRL